jgi:hypothetical protein
VLYRARFLYPQHGWFDVSALGLLANLLLHAPQMVETSSDPDGLYGYQQVGDTIC